MRYFLCQVLCFDKMTENSLDNWNMLLARGGNIAKYLLSLISRIFDFLWYSPAENIPQKRQLSKKLIKKDRDYLKEKLLTNKYSGRNISHHFWQGGAANDALLTGLELNIVDCSKTSHRGALLCNDRNLHGQVESVISGGFVYWKQNWRKNESWKGNCAND